MSGLISIVIAVCAIVATLTATSTRRRQKMAPSARGGAEIRDPWAPTPHENRSTIHAPVFGYSGHVPRVCPEHLPHEGRESCSEYAKSFQKPEAVRDTRDPRLTALEALSTMAPGGGAGALGTEAPVLLGTRSAPRPTAHEAYQIAKTIVG